MGERNGRKSGTATPRYFHRFESRPVSGLTSLDPSPSQEMPSGVMTDPHLLTVAGAAAALRFQHAPLSRLTAAESAGGT